MSHPPTGGGAPLAYAPYHRRSQSAASANGTSQQQQQQQSMFAASQPHPAAAHSGRPADHNSVGRATGARPPQLSAAPSPPPGERAQRPDAPPSQTPAAPPRGSTKPSSALSSSSSLDRAPPPLRKASELRNVPARLASSPSSSSKRQQASHAVDTPATAPTPPERLPAKPSSATATAPAAAAAAATTASSAPPPPPSSGHAKAASVSSTLSLMAPSVPHAMSTAEKLRGGGSGADSPARSSASGGGGRQSPDVASSSAGLPAAAFAHQIALLGGGGGGGGGGPGHRGGDTTSDVAAATAQLGGMAVGGAPLRSTTYRAGFQPRGAYRVRSDEFGALRDEARRRRRAKARQQHQQQQQQPAAAGAHELGGSAKLGASAGVDEELEGQRLERRLEKLIALHASEDEAARDGEKGAAGAQHLAFAPAPSSWGAALLQSTRAGRRAERERWLRGREMELVRWEDDGERRACAICSTRFSLAVRRHHCRLCGRLVCASPHLSQPQLGVPPLSTVVGQQKCSGLVAADRATGKLRDVPKLPVAGEADGAAVAAQPEEGQMGNGGERKGVRICRDCREVIVRRQYMMDPGHVPRYLQLYEELMTLQREIEQTLPEFQEMVLGIQKQDAAAALGTDEVVAGGKAPTAAAAAATSRAALQLQRDAAAARKQLLLNFANYDRLAKRIRALEPEPDLDGARAGGGASAGGDDAQLRLQDAIWMRANLFLQQNMFPLQSLPTSRSGSSGATRARGGRDKSDDGRGGGRGGGAGSNPSDAAVGATEPSPSASARQQLEVLEQQLRLVRGYAASARRARKLEDAATLQRAADELEAEVAALQAQAARV